MHRKPWDNIGDGHLTPETAAVFVLGCNLKRRAFEMPVHVMHGHPLMPFEPAKARKLLKAGKAK